MCEKKLQMAKDPNTDRETLVQLSQDEEGCCGCCHTEQDSNPYPLDGLLALWPLKKIIMVVVAAAVLDSVGWFALGFLFGRFVN